MYGFGHLVVLKIVILPEATLYVRFYGGTHQNL
jgi:hypothetical protein